MRSDTQGSCRILIEDDGIGISGPNRDGNDHYGLTIMNERAKRINGKLKIESEAGEGTQISLEFQHPGLMPHEDTTNSIYVEPPARQIPS